MPYTPVFSQGVKFIKIARVDDQGNDNTLSLQELNSIRIDYSNTDIVEYPITSISKYDDYFLFGVATTNVTSSTDNQVLDYQASGSKLTTIGGQVDDEIITNYTEAYDNLGYFNPTTGYYTLGNLTNIPIQLITSASVTGSTTGNVIIFINSSINGIVASTSKALGGSPYRQSLSASYSGIAQDGEQFYITITNTSLNNISFTGSFYVTQSTNPVAGISDLVVFQPYVDEDFLVSDYNVLAGDVLEPRINPFYMDVDYASNAIQAVNFDQIIAGTATRATVQQSNYTDTGWTNARYTGTKVNSINYNTYTPPTDYTDGFTSIFGYTGSWPGDQSYGKKSSTDIYSNYFAVFTNIEQEDIFPDSGNVIINKLIDINGNIIDLTSNVITDPYYVGNKGITVSQIFLPKNQVNIYFATSSSLSFTSANTIIDAACDYKTILLYTGSDSSTSKFILDSKTPSITAEVSVRSFTTASGTSTMTNTIVENTVMALGGYNQFNSLVTQINGGTYDGRNFFKLSASAFDPSNNQSIDINNISLYNPNEVPVFDNQGDISVSSAYRFTPLTPTYVRVWLTSSNETNENSVFNSTVTTSQVKYLRPAKQDTSPTQILSGSIELYSEITSSYVISGGASMRMYTRLPKDNSVLINNIPSSTNGNGLLIPTNFNPDYDPIAIARRVGVI